MNVISFYKCKTLQSLIVHALYTDSFEYVKTNIYLSLETALKQGAPLRY